ncbi:MAG: hypothetical protein IT337_12745 [Thermomicrobiales bacterium]|nr:hypothetical protein [Thermomicrobiales bacterium]
MDSNRFDAFARRFASRTTRRAALRGAGAAALAALLGRAARPETASAHHCDYIGCGCATGTQHPCGGGLVCCPMNPGMPGGAGVCSQPSDCGGSCNDGGMACPASCNWGDACPGCCSGYCGDTGACGAASCTGLGCTCASGTYSPCDDGLVCCSNIPGLLGAPGTCQYAC